MGHSASLNCGNPTRTLYFTIELLPQTTGVSGGTNKVYASSRNLFFDYANPTSNTGNNDVYGSYSSINPNTIGGVQYEFLDNIGAHPLSWGTGTGRGATKIHDVVDAAWSLKNSYGWDIGFGVANEPNNLKGCRFVSGAPTSDSWWWPMTAAFYAYFWALVAGEIKSYAMSAHSWDPVVCFGEISQYNGSYSDCLENFSTSYSGVPNNVSGRGLAGYPDVRYPNLVFHYANSYGITMPSPSSFVYHSYYGQDANGSCATFVAYQQAAVKGIGPYGDAAWRFNGSRDGTAYYLAS